MKRRGLCASRTGSRATARRSAILRCRRRRSRCTPCQFNKGCYLGQEIVERIRAQGRVNKKLMRVTLEGDVPAAGTKTTVDGADAEVMSAVMSPESGGVVALAYVRQK